MLTRLFSALSPRRHAAALMLAALLCAALLPTWASADSAAPAAPAAPTAPADAATTLTLDTLGWAEAQGLCEFEPLEAAFDPTLTPVQVVTDAAIARTATEGKGTLRVTTDGRRILHVRGTPYEMGFQQGRLLAAEVKLLVNVMLQQIALADTLRTGRPFVAQLRKIYARAQPHIPPEFIEEARGLADGAGLTHEAVLLANIFPEQFHCSGFALWGKATADGKLYHGRVLDYMVGIGLQDVATVTVYEPDGRIPWVNVGYAGFLGSVTGMNARQVALGEMGGRGEGLWDGMPMSYLMRYTLERAETLDQALEIFQKTPRTCEYYYVVSDGKIPSARGMAATPEKLEIIEPGESHERLPNPVEDAVLLSSGDRYKRLVMRAKANYGRFTGAQGLALMRRPVSMQSNLHSVLFCPTDGRFWVANASKDNQPASEQTYAEYNLNELLKK